jgi:uncharacterized protein YjbJ (UPF0337 family)
MAADDKISNKAQEIKGKVKEALGEANNDPELRAEGRKDQTMGHLKNAGEKVKDAFKN